MSTASIKTLGWHEWLSKTNFSFLTGASHPHEMIRTAWEYGYASLAVNDFDGVYGLARSFRHHKKMEDEFPYPLKLHYGAEIHLKKDHIKPLVGWDTLAFIAQSWMGYRNLCMILSLAHRDSKRESFLTLEDILGHDTTDLIAIQPMRGMVRLGIDEERLTKLKDHMNGRFFMAISRHLHHSEDRWINHVLEVCKKFSIPYLLCQDAFFHERGQKTTSDLVTAIRTNLTMDEAVEYMFPNDERCLHSLEVLERRYRVIPGYEEALRLSSELAESCHFKLDELHYHYPQEFIPEGHTSQSYLEKLAWEGCYERFRGRPSDHLCKILEDELKLIAELGFADYFLTVGNIVKWARSQNILCQGRGSAANSSVCYMLGITNVNPEKFDLLVERFISKERGDPPDIDVDFEHERREEVIQYIYATFGRNRASMVANVITFRNKGALRVTGKALGMTEAVLTEVARTAKTKLLRGNGPEGILEHCRQNSKDQTGKVLSHTWKCWRSMAKRLRGFPSHLGIHSGGFMITHKELQWFSPIEPATMEGRTVIQWAKDDIEALGFFKIDVLALGMLTAIRKGFDYVARGYHQNLELNGIAHDVPTYEMIQKADTVGVFQIESRAQMSMLPRLRPEKFYDLVVEVAIIRPGPIQGKVIHPYLRRKHKLEPVTYPDDRLKPILEKTLGIAIFQEQAMRIAIAVGGFTPGEANELRRNIGAWNIKEKLDLDPMLVKLEQGMRANDIKEEFVQMLINQMKAFSDYGFPESHAVSFAHLAYVSSYLKRHYPDAFFCSLLNSQPMGFYSPHALLQAAKRDGVKIRPVCVHGSTWDSSMELRAEPHSHIRYDIRMGFSLIKSLTKKTAEYIVTMREKVGPWRDLQHFTETVKIPKHEMVILAFADVFAPLGISRSDALWQVSLLPYPATLETQEEATYWPDESPFEKVDKDFEAVGTSLYAHPSQVIKEHHWCYQPKLDQVMTSTDLAACAKDKVVDVFGMILVKQAPPSAKGMVFLTLEDEKGFINLAFTPQVYTKYYHLVDKQAFLCVRGKMQKDNLSHSILVNKVYEPGNSRIIPLVPTEAAPVYSVPSTEKILNKPRSYM
jgi:error-prone DNA polymerase